MARSRRVPVLFALGAIALSGTGRGQTSTPTPTLKTPTPTTTANRVADLGVSMNAAPLPAVIGQDLTYTLAVTNGGPSSVPPVVAYATDSLPAGVTLVSYTASSPGPMPPSCTLNGSSVVCTFQWLQPAGQVVIVVRPTMAGLLTNTASVDGSNGPFLLTDPNPSNNTASATIEVLSGTPTPGPSPTPTIPPPSPTASPTPSATSTPGAPLGSAAIPDLGSAGRLMLLALLGIGGLWLLRASHPR